MPLRARWLAFALVLGCSSDGHSLSQAELGALLASGDVSAVFFAGTAAFRRGDYEDARRLWRRAGDLGDPEALSNLGFLVYHGWGGRSDSALGVALWREAADSGAPEAHRHLAQAIIDGDTSVGSNLDAYAHAVAGDSVARTRPDPEAAVVARQSRDLAARVKPLLSAAELRIADSLGRSWTRLRP